MEVSETWGLKVIGFKVFSMILHLLKVKPTHVATVFDYQAQLLDMKFLGAISKNSPQFLSPYFSLMSALN